MSGQRHPDRAGQFRILHLSDPHLTGGKGFDEDGVDARSALVGILRDARFVEDLDLVVVSGDIADDGSAAGCAVVREQVGAFAAARGIPHVYTTGNHDTRPGFSAVFGSGHLDADGVDVGRLYVEGGDERAAVSQVHGLRVITLDSLVPGQVHGNVSEGQLAWVREVLTEPAPGGSIVVLHHPPILPASRYLSSIVLRNGTALGQALAGSDVHVVLCGHLHLQLSGTLNGVPVWVTPGIVTRADLTAPPSLLQVVTGAGATVVELGGPFSPMFHVLQARDPQAGALVYQFDTTSGQDVAQEVEQAMAPAVTGSA
jgi:Icc protein